MASTPTLTIEAGNPDGLAKFYLALGFTQVSREDGRVELDRGGLRLSILSGPVTGPAPHDSPIIGPQLTLQVDDVESLRAALLAAGGETATSHRSAWSGTVVLDPDGNAVRLLDPAPSTPAATPNAAEQATTPPTAPTSHTAASPAQPAEPTTTAQPAAAPAAASDDLRLPQSHLPASYYNEAGIPTFDAVAERIHQQSATAVGNQVLDAESQRGQEESDTMDKLKRAGKDRLDQLRKSMGI